MANGTCMALSFAAWLLHYARTGWNRADHPRVLAADHSIQARQHHPTEVPIMYLNLLHLCLPAYHVFPRRARPHRALKLRDITLACERTHPTSFFF